MNYLELLQLWQTFFDKVKATTISPINPSNEERLKCAEIATDLLRIHTQQKDN
jgi:hypothetical protein